ncbi:MULTISPECIES: asparaginase domain-containing protein [Sphingomonadaceae]|jgi:L-asparaginase|uniref:Asparaginase n=1 Tax=Novosphingobium resinovorum TaxID=158500 RepID=A0A031JUA0_9SPHN|nr:MULTISPECIES: asparaginase domain-containing protein [Sphingomonadaceae]AOR76937.1 asparaginase [Novosphingobium resinovorum]EJU08907.1 L-asparaginase [Sphingomonas sp. LH128]EZP80363.1 L-asparaginase [Novosphingobium resinovorum]GLK46718.1 asparaginase [Novosphingobium resinovorum]
MNQAPILVITTGGTIDKQYFDALSEYQIVESVIGKLLATARVAHPFRVVELLRKDSLELTDEDRALIAATVAGAPESHVVITHGTDTMTDTAAALAHIEGKTVVMCGAMQPARFAESDAAFNLGMAFGCCQSAGPGIWITMSGTVFDALKVRKDREAGKFVAR